MQANRIKLLFGAAVLLVVLAAASHFLTQQTPGVLVDSAEIKRGDLSVLFYSNVQSPRLLSGVQSMFNVRHAPDFDAFDPDSPGQSAGLNLEHIYGGHRTAANLFSPRSGPYQMYRRPDGNSVTLMRVAEDGPWAVSNTMTYTVCEPHYVDIEFRCIAHDASLFGPRGYAIFFFANYMNDVFAIPLHFRGVEEPGGDEKWILGDVPKEHPHWRGGGTYRSLSAAPLEYDDNHNAPFNVWSYDWPRFTKPMCYGRAARGMVYILMFDRMYSEADEIRFSIFRSKPRYVTRPAWDFQYVIHKVSEEQEYGFRARVVWKKFISPEDCLQEYETWVAGLRSSP